MIQDMINSETICITDVGRYTQTMWDETVIPPYGTNNNILHSSLTINWPDWQSSYILNNEFTIMSVKRSSLVYLRNPGF